jgi:hypothetical protein
MPQAKGPPSGTGAPSRIRSLNDVAHHDYDAADAYLSPKLESAAAAPPGDPGVMKPA